jgi:hypothetical protein
MSFERRAHLVALFLLLTLAGNSDAKANEQEYAARLAPLVDPAKLATLGLRGANPRVLKCVYWLETGRKNRADPRKVLDQALSSVKMHGAAAELTKAALLRNLKIAGQLGCLRKQDLEEMRQGDAPIVRKGPYKGDTISVDHIIPVAVAPELDHVMANLELMPSRMNSSKNDTITSRQKALAKDLNKAGLLSTKGLKAVLSR